MALNMGKQSEKYKTGENDCFTILRQAVKLIYDFTTVL